MKQKINDNRKDPEKWITALSKVEKTIELTRKTIRLKFELGLGIWMRYHAVKGTEFKRLKQDEKFKLFDEYSKWYQGAFGKVYEPSGSWMKSRNVKDFAFQMDHSMPKILKQMKSE